MPCLAPYHTMCTTHSLFTSQLSGLSDQQWQYCRLGSSNLYAVASHDTIMATALLSHHVGIAPYSTLTRQMGAGQ